MTKCAQESHTGISSINSIVYSPLLDMKPADHEIIITAMYEAKRLDVRCYGYVQRDLKTSEYDLREMHTLMSFVGRVGMLMPCSDLEDVLKVALEGFGAMMAGKTFPHSFKALRMITEELTSFSVL